MKSKLLSLSFFSILLVGILHQVGVIFYFYWHSVWFDLSMHFLGALSIGFLFLWLWHSSGIFEKSIPSKKSAMLGVLTFVMLIGLGWEFFEYAHGIAAPIGGNYPLDTFHDLLADLVGGVVVGLIGGVRSLYT